MPGPITIGLIPSLPFHVRCIGCKWKGDRGGADDAVQAAVAHTKSRTSCVVFVQRRDGRGGEEVVEIVERRPLTRRRRSV